MLFKQRALRKNLEYYRKNQRALRFILEAFDTNKITYAIVGSFIRRTLEDTPDAFRSLNDIDIIVDISSNEIKSILMHFGMKFDTNSNGGFRVHEFEDSLHPDFHLDIWPLCQHIPFMKANVKANFKHLEKQSLLSIDSAAWIPLWRKLYSSALEETMKTGTISFVGPVYNDGKVAARLKFFKNKLGYELTEACEEYMKCMFLNSNRKTREYYKYLCEKYDGPIA